MKTRNMALYAIALAILIVGLAFAGVPASTLLVAALVLACPLMMLVMMSGMRGSGQSSRPVDEPPDRRADDNAHRNNQPKP